MLEKKEMKLVKQLLDVAENNLRQAKTILFSIEVNERAEMLEDKGDSSVVEGVFDGEFMIAPDRKKYPVPANYASKSKLIPGDILKLTISTDGTFLFKQIGPIKRKKIIATLEEVDKGRFVAMTEKESYKILLASVTYFKAQNGDKLTIIVPEEGQSEWAAVENVLIKEEKEENGD